MRILPVLFSAGLLAVSASSGFGQAPSTPGPSSPAPTASGTTPAAIPLWPNGAPGAHGTEPTDIPTITPYLPAPGTATGAALLICPGGGYAHLSMTHEGSEYAKFFNAHGVAGFVLTYRLGTNNYHYPEIFEDAQRAMRYLRAHAADFGIDPQKIGVIGSSAGGHLASTLLTHFDDGKANDPDPIERQGDKPALGILCYPVITMGEFAHGGSKLNLLGPNPTPELVDLLSNEKQVTPQTPQCFIWQTWEDQTVKVENSLMFASALRAKGVEFDLHIYQKGRHGLGLGAPWDQPDKMLPWTRDCIYWLKLQGFVK